MGMPGRVPLGRAGPRAVPCCRAAHDAGRRGYLVELRVPMAVRADLHAGVRRLEDLAPAQHPARPAARRMRPASWIQPVVTKTVAVKPYLCSRGSASRVEIGEPVVEREHYRPRRGSRQVSVADRGGAAPTLSAW